jgi:hypothetical protein
MKVHLIKEKTIRNYIRGNASWIGTHAAYDKLCKEGKQYIINDY